MTALSGASEPRAVILSGSAAKDLCRRDAGYNRQCLVLTQA
jgi:hypothetical protein